MAGILKLYLVIPILVQYMAIIHNGQISHTVPSLVATEQKQEQEIAQTQFHNMEVQIVLSMESVLKLCLVIHILVQYMVIIHNGQILQSVQSRVVTEQKQEQEIVQTHFHNMEERIVLFMELVLKLCLVTHILVQYMAIIHNGHILQSVQSGVVMAQSREQEIAQIQRRSMMAGIALGMVVISTFSPVTHTAVQ